MKRIHTCLTIALGLSVSAIAPACASVYANASNSTRIALHETGSNPVTGEYFTQVGSETWGGSVNVKGEGMPGSLRYSGTFSDSFTSPSSSTKICTGDITLTRRAVGRTTQLGLSIEWVVKGGSNCPSVGQTFNMSLTEPYPTPDRNGDFVNPSGWNGGTQDSTWGAWKVAETALNCRSTPNGTVQKVYSQNTGLLAKIERSGSAIVTSPSGAPWLRTQDNCYVRANSRYITPSSWLPVDFAR